MESGEGIERFVLKALAFGSTSVESGEGIERENAGGTRLLAPDRRVESGEGIERCRSRYSFLGVTEPLWNPVKELKALE